MDALDYLDKNKNALADAALSAAKARRTIADTNLVKAQAGGAAADLDAKLMSNQATRGIMGQYASDPTTQFIAMHPEVAGALISTQQYNMRKGLQQKIIQKLQNDSSLAPDQTSDPMQQKVLDSVGMGQLQSQASPAIGANPDTNLPASNINDPALTTTDSNGAVGPFDEQPDAAPNLGGGADYPQPAAPEQSDGGQGGPSEEADPANEYSALQQDLGNHRKNASDYTKQAVKAADFYNMAKMAGLDVTNAKAEALQNQARLEMEQANQKLQLASNNPKIIAQKNAVEASSKVIADAQQSAVNAQTENEKLATLKETIKGLPTGSAAPARQKLGEFLSGFGFDPSKYDLTNVASQQELVKSGVLDQVFGSVKQAVGGRVSGQEMNTFYQKLPSLLMTPEGNQKIIDFMQAANSSAPAYYNAAQKWMSKHNNDLILSSDKNGNTFNDSWIKSRGENNILKQYQANQSQNKQSETAAKTGSSYKKFNLPH